MNMNITVEMVADSVNPRGKRITSMLWTYPRFIHAEIMTHRSLSRNAASSRAIPVSRMIAAVQDNPAMPEWWGKAQGGMKADDRFEPGGDEEAELLRQWLLMRDLTIGCDDKVVVPLKEIVRLKTAWEEGSGEQADCWTSLWDSMSAIKGVHGLLESGLHKQIANRPLEPWMRITVLVTATEWDNFFGLRAHKDAQPEFQVLAYRALACMLGSTPARREWGEWHIPFDPQPEFGASERESNDPPGQLDIEERLIVSTARAARTSYVAFGADKTFEEQRNLYLLMRDNGHWSPFEHQAQASQGAAYGNFSGGWLQHRHLHTDEQRKVPSWEALLAAKPDWITI